VEDTNTTSPQESSCAIMSCPVCNGLATELYIDGDDSEISVQSVGSSRTLLSHGRVLRCRSCGLAYRSFRPTNDQLSRLYRAADDRTYEAEMSNRLRTAERHRRIINKFIGSTGTLLDVGCASGAFLRLMRESGWRVAGVEPSESQFQRASAALGPGADIQQCVLQEASLQANFDLVTMWDVLEHVTNPREFLALAASLLRPGGCLVLNVPRIDSVAARLLGRHWPVLLAEHLNYFTVPSLRICGEAAGLALAHAGQRPAAFSLGYILFRASQHHIPGSVFANRMVGALGISKWSLPIWIGEVYAVYLKDRAAGIPLEGISKE
jgi:SAM-dependent methyltransferase